MQYIVMYNNVHCTIIAPIKCQPILVYYVPVYLQNVYAKCVIIYCNESYTIIHYTVYNYTIQYTVSMRSKAKYTRTSKTRLIHITYNIV